MRRRLIRIALILLLFPPLLGAVAGWLAGPAYLHPIRRALTPDLIREADAAARGPKQLWVVPGAYHTAAPKWNGW
jgi:hypothetical protein